MDKIENLYQLLEHSAEFHPESTALVYNSTNISYKQLLGYTHLIAQQLSGINFGPGNRLAIYCHKSPEFVYAIFAGLKCKGAYVPIDANAPFERNQQIIEDAEAKALIVSTAFLHHFDYSYDRIAEIFPGLFLLQNKKKQLKISDPELAYILYTSGSTGKPKGVMHSHEGALEFINWSVRAFSPLSTDCFSSHAPFHFDLSIFDLFVAIKQGAKLVLIDENTAKQPLLLASFISKHAISIWYSTPTILTMLTAFGKMEKYEYSNLRLILFAGEVFHTSSFNELRRRLPHASYFNLYGPTETNVCTYYKVPDAEAIEAFPIGICCEHYQSKLLPGDSNQGELCISGKGLMLGYWKLDNKNETVFFKENNHRWYKTGDLVIQQEHHSFLFKGRMDRMIKKNGFRIEPGEIESALSSHPNIIESAVIPTKTDENQITLTAFLVVSDENEKSFIKMKEYCLKHLPIYMIPDNFRFLNQLPKTSSDKVDYQKLNDL